MADEYKWSDMLAELAANVSDGSMIGTWDESLAGARGAIDKPYNYFISTDKGTQSEQMAKKKRANEVGIAKDEFVTALVSKLGSYAPEALSYDDYSAGLRGFLPSLTEHFSRNLPDTRAETMAREQKLGNVDTSTNSVPQLMTVLKQAAEAKKQQEAAKGQEIDSRLQQLMNQSEKGTQVFTADSTGITGRGEGQNADGKLGGGTFSKTPGRGFGGGGATQGLQEAFKVLTSLGVDANQAKRIVLSQVLPEGIRKGAEGAFNRMDFAGLDSPAKLEEIFMKLMKTDGNLADKKEAVKTLARINGIPPEEVEKFFPSKKPQ